MICDLWWIDFQALYIAKGVRPWLSIFNTIVEALIKNSINILLTNILYPASST